MAKNPKQDEMKTMAGRDAVGKAAASFIEKRTAATEAKAAQDKAAAKLVGLMRDADRKSINVDGVAISLQHIEAADVLKIKQPHQRKK